MRPVRAALFLKLAGAPGVCEVLAAPLASAALEWLQEVLGCVAEAVEAGNWAEVFSVCKYLTCAPPCACNVEGTCGCAVQQLWLEVGWRRLTTPEPDGGRLPIWWSGVTDALGRNSVDGLPWLRCSCGCVHDMPGAVMVQSKAQIVQ